jgi:hypothetical protein
VQLSEGVSAQGGPCWSLRGACSSVRALLVIRGECVSQFLEGCVPRGGAHFRGVLDDLEGCVPREV